MADGSVIIDSKMDTSGVEIGEKELKESLKRMTASIDGLGEKTKSSIQKQISSLSKASDQIDKQVSKVNALKNKLQELSDQKIETSEYKNISKEIDSIYEKVAKLEATLNEWNNIGVPENSSAFKKTEAELQKALDDIDKLYAKQEEMKTAGIAYVDTKSLSEYKSTAEELSAEEQKLDEMNDRLSSSFSDTEQYIKQCAEESQKASSGFSNIGKSIEKFSQKLMTSGISGLKNKIKETAKSVDNLLKKLIKLTSGAIVSGFKKISSGIWGIHKSANKSTMSIGKMLKTILKYSIGIRSLYVLFNKLRSAVVTGFNNLAQYDPAGNVNKSLSALKSSLTQLKNSFATAFAPILTTVAPIMVKFINLISEAVTRVGMLVAALTGQKTFTKAIGVQENYAASLDKTADSAKEATKAIQGYLSPIDELNRYESGNINTGSGTGGGSSNPSASDMFEEVPITSSIKGVADKIRKLIKAEDWEGLGAYIASGINKGLKKVYDAISWDNVGPKVAKFVNAFTRTFNSLVDNIDWDLLGRTIGTGINTLVNTLNLLITGINWHNLGKKFAEGITGLVNEVNWNNLGQLLGNKFMITWKIFSGFVHNLPYADIGKAFADTLNGVFSTISFAEIADALATGLNGAFTSLYNFAIRFNWKQLVDNIAGGINTFVAKFDWKGNGQKLEVFLTKLCNALTDFVKTTDWEAVGKGIGDFLAQIDWWGHLKQVVDAIKDTLGGLFDGLEESGTAGKIVAFLGKAFLAVKIAQITGISSLVKALVGFIGKKLIGSEATASLTGTLTNLLGKAASGAAGGITSLATAIGPFVGAAGLCALLAVGTGEIATKVSSLIDSANGGNGVITDFGYTVDELIGIMQRSNTITADERDELFLLKEQLENTDASADEYGAALADAMTKGKVSSDDLQAAVSQLKVEMNLTEDETAMLTSLLDQMGQKTDETATKTVNSATLSKEQWSSMKDSLLTLYTQGVIPLDDQLTQLSGTLQSQEAAGATAEVAYGKMKKEMENMGMTTEDISTVLSTLFPDATTAVKTAVDTNIVGAQEQISSSMATAKADVEDATSSMASDTKTNTGSVKTDTDDSFKEVTKTSKSEWKESYGAVKDALGDMQKDTLEAMKNIMGYIQSYWQSVVIDTNSTWELMSRKVETELSKMADNADTYGKKMANNLVDAISGAETPIIRSLNNIISKVNGTVDNINNSIAGIESGFTFQYNVQIPNGGRRWGNYHLTLPRVNTVPYLASGAVIPPRSEFLAVLGDQKKGNNLETPESLLRQIVREESGNSNGNNGNTYNVTVNASGRKLLDIIIDEAEMRRNRNGKNPFELT